MPKKIYLSSPYVRRLPRPVGNLASKTVASNRQMLKSINPLRGFAPQDALRNDSPDQLGLSSPYINKEVKRKFESNLYKEIASQTEEEKQMTSGHLSDGKQMTCGHLRARERDTADDWIEDPQSRIRIATLPLESPTMPPHGELDLPAPIIPDSFSVPSVSEITRISAQIFPQKKPNKPARTVKLYVTNSMVPEIAGDDMKLQKAGAMYFNTTDVATFHKAIKRNKDKMSEDHYETLKILAEAVDEMNTKLRRSDDLNTERATIGYLCRKDVAGAGTINHYNVIAIINWKAIRPKIYSPEIMLFIDGEPILIGETQTTGNKNPKACEWIGFYDPHKLWQQCKAMQRTRKPG